MGKRLWNGLFVFLLLAGLLAGLGKTLLWPKDINYYENRYADKAAPLTAAGLLDGSFQDALEAALADQIPAAQQLKRAYHLGYSTYQRMTALPLSEGALSDRLMNIGHVRMYDGFLCFWFRYLELDAAGLARKAENLSAAFAAHPDTEFFVYYIEKDTDCNPETGEKSGAYEYLRTLLPLDDAHVARFEIDGFDDLRRDFFRTDHHWNCAGAYRGYTEILAMLAPGETPLRPLETVNVGSISGSKTRDRATASFREDFPAYRFAFPEMAVYINGTAARDYGSQDIYLDGQATAALSYGSFYGDDEGRIGFRVPENAGKGTLLVVGDSFDNALLKLLASHFEETYSVDLRYYLPHMGEDFRLGTFLAEHPDAKVLLVGNIDFFTSDDFSLEG